MPQTLEANPFKDTRISKLLIKFSAPAVAGMFVIALHNIISRIYIGRSIGALGIAGIAIVFPLAVGLLLGPECLTGFLGGAIVTGVLFALFMSNAGGLWDNAKKYVEAGNFGGKGSEAHKAAVIGDTVGDPFKDTAGPSLNTLITVMSLVASTFAPVIAIWHLF